MPIFNDGRTKNSSELRFLVVIQVYTTFPTVGFNAMAISIELSSRPADPIWVHGGCDTFLSSLTRATMHNPFRHILYCSTRQKSPTEKGNLKNILSKFASSGSLYMTALYVRWLQLLWYHLTVVNSSLLAAASS